MRRVLSLVLVLAGPALVAQGRAATAPRTAAAAQAPAQQQALVITAANRTAASDAAAGRRRPNEDVRAGDVVRYTLVFTNRQAVGVKNVVVRNPIPAELRFVAGSARASRPDARLEYSADKGQSWSAQPMETVVENGRSLRRPVAPDRYTDVRWTVAGFVEPRASFTAEYEARLPEPSTPASPSSSAPQRTGGR